MGAGTCWFPGGVWVMMVVRRPHAGTGLGWPGWFADGRREG